MRLRRRTRTAALAILASLALHASAVTAAVPDGEAPPPLDAPRAPASLSEPAALAGPMTTSSQEIELGAGGQPGTPRDDFTPASLGTEVPRLQASDVATAPFVLIGFSWQGAAEGDGGFRVHTADGWQPWHPLDAHDDHVADPREGDGDPSGERTTSDPVWVGWADGWQVELPAGTAAPVVHLVRPASAAPTPPPHSPAGALDRQTTGPITPAPTPSGLGTIPAAIGDLDDAETTTAASLDPPGAPPASAAGNDGRPPISTRAAWGARPPTADNWTALRLHAAIVHHTGSGESSTYGADEVPAMLRAVQAFHIDARGWNDIGYNYLIDRFGRVWEGRAGGIDKLVVGAQAAGLNTGSFGVAVLGDFSTAAPTQASIDALVSLIAWKFVRHGVDPTKAGRLLARSADRYAPGTVITIDRIVGHGDVGLTGCPGDLSRFLPFIRTGVAARVSQLTGPGTFTTTMARAMGGQPAVGDFNGDGRADIFWYRGGSANDVLWTARGDGTFATTTYQVGGAFSVKAADYDGDGADDLVFSANGAHQLLWGRHRGRMVNEVIAVAGDASPVPVDFDGDGDEDLLWYSATTRQASLWEYTGDGGTNRTEWPLGNIGGPYRFAVGDFNGDLRDDVFFYGPGGTGDWVWNGAATGLFDRRSTSVDGDYTPVAVDLNGDQYDDIVWQAPSGSVPMWWGGPSFSGAATSLPAGAALLAGDAVGSGDGSLFAAGPGTQVAVWLADRQGALHHGPSAVATVTQPLVGDFTGDGQSDVLWWRADVASPLWVAR